MTNKNTKEFWARVQVTFTIYLKKGFGIYSVDELNGFSSYTIKGNTIIPLITGCLYEVKIARYWDSKRNEYANDILEIYEVEPQDNDEEYFIRLRLPKSLKYDQEFIDEMQHRVALDAQARQLVEYNMSFKDAKKFTQEYGDKALTTVQHNPYVLLDVTNYITFSECDKIANSLQYNAISSIRITSAIREVIKAYCNETGNTFCPVSIVLKHAKQKLDYYLDRNEMQDIVNTHTDEYFDYSVFNFENLVCLSDIKEFLAKNQPYLFCNVGEDLINNEIYSAKNVDKFEVDFYGQEEVLELAELCQDENEIAESIKAFNNTMNTPSDIQKVRKLMAQYEKRNGLTLTKEQKEAVEKVLEMQNGGFYVINGSAGTGKTTVVKCILDVYRNLNNWMFYTTLVAPTGRASDVLTKAVGLHATTIHKALVYDPETDSFGYNKLNQLNTAIMIVDETSMLDTWLCARLLEAISVHAKIIFLGDDKQLPSVGPGKVLRDILDSYANVITLTEVKRQQKQSGILENAISILNQNQLTQYGDSVVLHEDAANRQERRIQAACLGALKHFQSEDIQVLLPMKVGSLGTRNINRILQPLFNPQYMTSQIKVKEADSYNVNGKYYENYLCVGDKVINTRNMHRLCRYSDDKVVKGYIFGQGKQVEEKVDEVNTCIGIGVMNGEIGTVVDIRETDVPVINTKSCIIGINHVTRIVVKYPSYKNNGTFDYVFYDDESDALMLAYAVTIHKSQGSSWPCTITAVHKSHSRMICNELLYVAATRATKLNCFIVDDEIYNDKIGTYMNQRRTFLAKTIQKELRTK